MEEMLYLLLYYCLINIIGAAVNIIDKLLAIKGMRRISEKTLWLIAIMGGAAGSYAAMKKIRHKTRHKSFMVGMPILIIVNLICICGGATIYYFCIN